MDHYGNFSEINKKQIMMRQIFNEKQRLLDQEMISISQELDQLILLFHAQQEKKKENQPKEKEQS